MFRSASELPVTRYLFVSTWAFSLFALFFKLGRPYLVDWDEAWYAIMAKNALYSHKYLTLEFRGHIFWDKSPFPLYPMIGLFKLFGVNELTARLSSALFGFGIFVQIYFIAKRFYGKAVALLSVVIMTTSTQIIFYHGLSTANIDGITLFFMIGVLSCWLLINRSDYKIIFTMISLGFTFLCKGPIIAIPFTVILLSFVVDRSLLSWRYIIAFFLGLAAMLFIAAPWYLYMLNLFGDEFVRNHILHNFVQRYTAGIEGHHYGSMFFLKTLSSPKNYLWFGTAIASLLYFLHKFIKERKSEDFIFIMWFVVAFIIVNYSQTKLAWYILPVYPPLSIMISRALGDFFENRSHGNAAVFFAGVCMSSYFIARKLIPHDITEQLAIALAFVIMFSVTLCLLRRYRPALTRCYYIFLLIIILSFPMYQTIREVNSRKTDMPPIMSFVESLNRDKPYFAYNLEPSSSFYLSQKTNIKEYYKLSDLLDKSGALVLISASSLNTLRSQDIQFSVIRSSEGICLISLT